MSIFTPIKRLLVRLFWDFGSVFSLLAPTSAFLTYALIKDSILVGVFLRYQWAWVLCGLAGTSLLSTLLFIWLTGLARQFTALVELCRPSRRP